MLPCNWRTKIVEKTDARQFLALVRLPFVQHTGRFLLRVDEKKTNVTVKTGGSNGSGIGRKGNVYDGPLKVGYQRCARDDCLV